VRHRLCAADCVLQTVCRTQSTANCALQSVRRARKANAKPDLRGAPIAAHLARGGQFAAGVTLARRATFRLSCARCLLAAAAQLAAKWRRSGPDTRPPHAPNGPHQIEIGH